MKKVTHRYVYKTYCLEQLDALSYVPLIGSQELNGLISITAYVGADEARSHRHPYFDLQQNFLTVLNLLKY